MQDHACTVPVYRALTIANAALARDGSGELVLRAVVSSTLDHPVEINYDLRPSTVAVERAAVPRSKGWTPAHSG